MSLLPALTTLTHLFALPLAPTYTYSSLVLASTGVSFIWHWKNKEGESLKHLDYQLAALWGFTDLLLAEQSGHFVNVLLVSSLVAACGMFTETLPVASYDLWHSLWHLLSAARACYVVFLISR
jgi:hypothetical protein